METYRYVLEDASDAEFSAAVAVGTPQGHIRPIIWHQVSGEAVARDIERQMREVAPNVLMSRDVDGWPGRKGLVV